MKTMKRIAALLLTLCLLVGLPISVSHAADTPLTVTQAKLFADSYEAETRLGLVFSEPINAPSSINCMIGIYYVTDAGVKTDGGFRYVWDSANRVCTSAYQTTDASDTAPRTQWSIQMYKQHDNVSSGQKGWLVRINDSKLNKITDIFSVYRAVIKAVGSENCRLVIRFLDTTDDQDGVIETVMATTANADGSAKYLQANVDSITADWAEIPLDLFYITDVSLYGTDKLAVTFNSELKDLSNPITNNTTWTLGWAKNGEIDTTQTSWPLDAANASYYGADKTTIIVPLADGVYESVTSNAPEGYSLAVKVTETLANKATNCLLASVKDAIKETSLFATRIEGEGTPPNAIVGSDVHVFEGVKTDCLFATDWELCNRNQILVTFNQPVSYDRSQFYAGLAVYATSGSMRGYKDNGDGTYSFAGPTDSGYDRAQWGCTLPTTGATGNQVILTCSKNFDTIWPILEAADSAGHLVRLRFEENTASADGMVTGIWATDDSSQLLLSSRYSSTDPGRYFMDIDVSHGMPTVAVIGTNEFATLGDALNEAKDGETITLIASAKMDLVRIPVGVTLDLNGHSVTADHFLAFGYVIDSTEAGGALIVSRDRTLACIHMQTDNPYFPLYDAEIAGYRFFTYSFNNVGTKTDAGNIDRVTYGMKLKFDSLRAYELLADDANVDVALIVQLAIGSKKIEYKFTHNIFNSLYQTVKNNDFAMRGNYAITLTISGLDTVLLKDKIVATPVFNSAQKVGSTGISIAYEGEYDSYTRAKAWIAEQINNNTLFSFTYDGVAYADHMNENNWTKNVTNTNTGWIVSYTHKEDNVVAWSEIIFDPETTSVEWTNYFKNNGTSNSPIISDVRAMDSTVTVENPILTSANGSTATATDFQPFSVDLTQTTEYVGKMKTSGGRSSQGAFPYFDISNGEYGVMGGIGWTGNWNANFVNDNGDIAIDTGMQKVSTYLEKGEQMRTPMMMIQFFKGDQDDGHNALRQLMLKSYTPSDESGDPIEHAMLSVGVVNLAGYGEAEMLEFAKDLDAANSKYEAFWIDAGWFGDASGDTLSNNTWTKQVGNWYFIPEVYKDNDGNGIRDIQQLSQYLQERDKELILWFEPERVYFGTELYGTWGNGDELLSTVSVTRLWNFANDDACDAMITRINTIIKENNVTWYRQDFNIEPEAYWSNADSSDRIGITEIKYITNLYRYMDALVESNPGLMIDNCAAGGRRLDLEMMKRSVPLWNSDYGNEKPDINGNGGSTPDGIRAVNYNLTWWLPIHAGSWPNYNSENTTYAFRADMNSGMQLDLAKATNSWVQTLTSQYFTCRELMNGDYYILASGKDDGIETEDACYEFYKSEQEKGYLVAFRPKNCTTESSTYCLKGLDAKATYELEIVDGDTLTMTGRELMTDGLTINYSKVEQSLLIYFKKA